MPKYYVPNYWKFKIRESVHSGSYGRRDRPAFSFAL